MNLRVLLRSLALAAVLLPPVWAVAQVSRPMVKTAVTVTGSSAKALNGHTRNYLAILNESATDTIACNFGSTAVVNGAGSQTIGPLAGFVWDGLFIPSDQINCISSGTSTAVTFYE
jgi:hypothetical protein